MSTGDLKNAVQLEFLLEKVSGYSAVGVLFRHLIAANLALDLRLGEVEGLLQRHIDHGEDQSFDVKEEVEKGMEQYTCGRGPEPARPEHEPFAPGTLVVWHPDAGEHKGVIAVLKVEPHVALSPTYTHASVLWSNVILLDHEGMKLDRGVWWPRGEYDHWFTVISTEHAIPSCHECGILMVGGSIGWIHVEDTWTCLKCRHLCPTCATTMERGPEDTQHVIYWCPECKKTVWEEKRGHTCPDCGRLLDAFGLCEDCIRAKEEEKMAQEKTAKAEADLHTPGQARTWRDLGRNRQMRGLLKRASDGIAAQGHESAGKPVRDHDVDDYYPPGPCVPPDDTRTLEADFHARVCEALGIEVEPGTLVECIKCGAVRTAPDWVQADPEDDLQCDECGTIHRACRWRHHLTIDRVLEALEKQVPSAKVLVQRVPTVKAEERSYMGYYRGAIETAATPLEALCRAVLAWSCSAKATQDEKEASDENEE